MTVMIENLLKNVYSCSDTIVLPHEPFVHPLQILLALREIFRWAIVRGPDWFPNEISPGLDVILKVNKNLKLPGVVQ